MQEVITYGASIECFYCIVSTAVDIQVLYLLMHHKAITSVFAIVLYHNGTQNGLSFAWCMQLWPQMQCPGSLFNEPSQVQSTLPHCHCGRCTFLQRDIVSLQQLYTGSLYISIPSTCTPTTTTTIALWTECKIFLSFNKQLWIRCQSGVQILLLCTNLLYRPTGSTKG